MSSVQERIFIRTLHLVLSIPIIGFIYGPVAHIPPAATFTRFVAVPLVVISPSFSTRGVCDPESRSRTRSWLKGLHYRRALSAVIEQLSPRADARWWLGR